MEGGRFGSEEMLQQYGGKMLDKKSCAWGRHPPAVRRIGKGGQDWSDQLTKGKSLNTINKETWFKYWKN